MSPEWAIIIYLRRFCMASFPLTTLSEGHQRGVIKTFWRNHSVPATLTIASGLLWLPTTAPDAISSTRLTPFLEIFVKSIWRKNAAEGRIVKFQQLYLTWLDCSRCGHTCLSRIGLISHESMFFLDCSILKTHKNYEQIMISIKTIIKSF